MKLQALEAGMFEPWRAQYASFKHLKRILKRCVAIKQGEVVVEELADEERDRFKGDQTVFFFHVVDQQVEKVSAFFNTTLAHCQARSTALASRTPALLTQGANSQFLHSLEVLQAGAQSLLEDLEHLRDFAALNADGLRWILERFDAKMAEAHAAAALQKIAHHPFLSTGPSTLDALIAQVASQAAELSRLVETSALASSEMRLVDRIVVRALDKDDAVALDSVFSSLEPRAQPALLPALLREAAIRGACACAEQCLAWGASSAWSDQVSGDTVWHSAIQSAHSKLLALLAAKSPRSETAKALASSNREGLTPLHLAARLGHSDCAAILLDAGADVNAPQTSNGQSPLVDAVKSGSLECVQLLLQRGARTSQPSPTPPPPQPPSSPSPPLSDFSGEASLSAPSSSSPLPPAALPPSPLSVAASMGFAEIAKVLLASGADPAALDCDEETPLHKAARAGHLDVVRVLLATGKPLVDVRSTSSRQTPIFAAARHNRVEVVKELISAGATLHLRDINGWMAEAHALYRGFNELSELIQAKNIERAPPGALDIKSPSAAPSPTPDASSPQPDTDPADRKYGHTYLRDKGMLIVTIWSAAFHENQVRSKDGIHSDLSNCQLGVRVREAGAVSAPSFHSIPVPRQDESSFDISNPDAVSVEFELAYIVNESTLFARGSLPRVAWRESRRDLVEAVVPLFDHDLNQVGEVSCSLLVVLPFKHDLLAISKNTYWTIRKSYPVIGHRGAGAGKYARVGETQWRTHVQENTLLSFVTAANFGAEYVEFDVQLTRDGVPVIYHNWTLTDNVGYYLPVHMATLKQFEQIRLPPRPSFSKAVAEAIRSGSRPRALSDPKPLRGVTDDVAANISIRCESITLKDTLLHVPESLGFNIEIKFPQPEERDRWQLLPGELNRYIDAILACVYENAGNRKIFFSTFHPDVCRMLVLKQPNFPVFFLTCSGYWEKFSDPRAMSLRGAVRFASMCGAVGVVSEAKGLVQYPELIREVKSRGLLLVTWGKVNNEIRNIEIQRSWGVDAIITDHVAHVRKSLVRDQPAFHPVPIVAVKKSRVHASGEVDGEDKA